MLISALFSLRRMLRRRIKIAQGSVGRYSSTWIKTALSSSGWDVQMKRGTCAVRVEDLDQSFDEAQQSCTTNVCSFCFVTHSPHTELRCAWGEHNVGDATKSCSCCILHCRVSHGANNKVQVCHWNSRHPPCVLFPLIVFEVTTVYYFHLYSINTVDSRCTSFAKGPVMIDLCYHVVKVFYIAEWSCSGSAVTSCGRKKNPHTLVSASRIVAVFITKNGFLLYLLWKSAFLSW